ncbi:probable LRR receptor-like serine/threonine-protein kinase at4g08850 [Phtheirospermum japonicum]|uniref:Probable LRR receptor-like serine/threonine-protein kinase at4g08850 n=1 Tax=Phtheirospermum japonicum TaxID=374723 RepID=A0A830AYT4_9LAMI|nr:probable LRR receptor-like serine/threonine-protein kinase at4g08850 [Phtheirospermum japonicum]
MGSKILILLAISTLIATVQSKKNIEPKCHPNDLKGLSDFKTGIQSDTSGRLATWHGHACCQWAGITCDGTTGRVTQLNLPGFYTNNNYTPLQTYMIGQLSPSITLLTSLEAVDLSGLVGLTGIIPPSIGFHLPNIKKLSLWGNSFEGTLPDSIGLGNSLKMLDLHSNRLSGFLPEAISDLTSLEKLCLQNNFLVGHIPGNIGNLQRLKELDLSNNSLSGKIPSSLNKLKAVSIKRVSLANNGLIGPIPSNIGNLSDLTELYLNDNKLSGQIPSSIGQLSNLLMLRIANNMIEGPLPRQLALLQNLQTLDLSYNRINLRSIPDWLVKLPSLSRILLAGCAIDGDISDDLARTPSPIQELDLSSNNLTGKIPGWIGGLNNLYSLNLSKNMLVGEMPSSIVNLASLRILDLHSNKLSGSLKWGFRVESGLLRFIDLSDNSFTTGIEEIGMGLEIGIEYINFSNNLIRGGLPDSIGRLGLMKGLDLSCNKLDFELPASLGNAIWLESLKLQKNQFGGKIPNGFLNFKNLKELDLSDNILEGKIPFGKPLIDFPRGCYLGNKGLCGTPLEPCEP